ncbi:MAG: beta-lactamase family protein, partial [Burkholderiales bacterium]|nr:beta-lactamase family protein [Burkholderiales bacterium]
AVIDKSQLALDEIKLLQSVNKQILQILHKEHIPGMAVALVNESGIIWANAFGVANTKNNNPVSLQTLFSLQSQTKIFTTLGVLSAVQNQQLDLKTPIINYIPNLKLYSVYESSPANKITLIHLLSHTAGFAHDAPIGNNNNSRADFATHIQSILNGTWLQFKVGSDYNYSNVGMDLAGYILQTQSHQYYCEYMKQYVLIPLEMNSSTFNLEQFLNSNHAEGYIDGIDTAPYNYSLIPSGGMYSNVLDMAHYLQLVLNNGMYKGNQVLNKELFNTMLTIPFPLQGQTEGNALGNWKGQRLSTTYYSHLGRGFGFSNNLEWYPEYGLGIVVLSNKYTTNNVDVAVSHLILDAIIKKRQYQKRSQLQQYMVGEYISNMGSIQILKDKQSNKLALNGTVNSGPTGNTAVIVKSPIIFVEDNIFYLASDKKIHNELPMLYRYIAPQDHNGIATIERLADGYHWYFNQSAYMKDGPNKPSWQKFTGMYKLEGYGAPFYIKVAIKHGYLYIGSLKLIEHKPGIFAAANGQMLVFNPGHVSWMNLNLLRVKE